MLKENKLNEDLNEIILVQCFSCKKNYVESLMKPIKIKQIFEESYILVKRYLCPECFENLKQVRWVQEQNLKDKEMKGGKNGEIRKKDN